MTDPVGQIFVRRGVELGPNARRSRLLQTVDCIIRSPDVKKKECKMAGCIVPGILHSSVFPNQTR